MSDAATSVAATPLAQQRTVDMTATPPRTRRQAARPPLVFENADDESLLATRFCHLPMQLEGTLWRDG